MIDENKTFILFGYTSDKLSHGSNKKILCVCDICKKERLIQYRKYRSLCISCTQKGNKNPMFGKHHSKEAKCKISNAQFGNKSHMFGKHLSEEIKFKISKSNQGKHQSAEAKQKMSNAKSGDKNPRWKGGKKLAVARRGAKRRELFGFIPHNILHKDFHGHHIDFNHVIFIPKELHMSISHSVINNKNMNLINDLVCDWYLEFQLPSNM